VVVFFCYEPVSHIDNSYNLSHNNNAYFGLDVGMKKEKIQLIILLFLFGVVSIIYGVHTQKVLPVSIGGFLSFLAIWYSVVN